MTHNSMQTVPDTAFSFLVRGRGGGGGKWRKGGGGGGGDLLASFDLVFVLNRDHIIINNMSIDVIDIR